MHDQRWEAVKMHSLRTGPNSKTRLIAVVLLAVALLGMPAGAHAQSQSDVDKAKSDLARAKAEESAAFKTWDQARKDLAVAVEEYTEINRQREALTDTIAKLTDQIAVYETDAAAADKRAKDIVIDAYISGGNAGVEAAFGLGTIQEIIISQALLDEASVRGLSEIDQLAAVNREVERLKINLSDQEADLLVLEQEAAEVETEMQQLYAAADAAYAEASDDVRAAIDTVREEQRQFDIAEAKRKADQAVAAHTAAHGAAAGLAPGTIPGFICPVQGGSAFSNSWGWSRSGGTRTHKGTDMYSSTGYGHPIVAVQDGYIKKRTVNLGGTVVYLYDDAGYKYYYAHLQGYPDGLQDGQRVSRGDVIGYMGSSGNAGGPHLHFQIHPGGGAPVNPYPTVRAVC